MLCGICKEKEATVFYTEIINGAKKEQYLCGECAAKSTGLRLKAPFGNGEFSLGTLLSGLFEESVPGEEKGEDVRVAEPGSKLSCPGCGMAYPKFLEGGVLGCPSCYQSFGRTLLRKIRSIQGADVHTGREPKHFAALKEAAKTQETAPKLDERAKLSMQLKQAVEREDYELAARLRDALRAGRKQEAGCLDE